MIRIIIFISLLFQIYFSSCSKSCEKGAETKCICSSQGYAPVCGCNNVTYDNACMAQCNGYKEYTSGACK